MTNPFIARQDRPIGKTGRQAEKNLARRLGAGLTPASGAAGAKGDMVVGAWLVEAKSTTGDSLGVKYEWRPRSAARPDCRVRHRPWPSPS